MEVTDFFPLEATESELRARGWLFWVTTMRNRLEARREADTPRMRAWHDMLKENPHDRDFLLTIGERDMVLVWTLMGFLEQRLDYVE